MGGVNVDAGLGHHSLHFGPSVTSRVPGIQEQEDVGPQPDLVFGRPAV